MKKNNKGKYKAKKYSSSKKYHKKEPSKKKHNQNVYVNNSTSHTVKPRKHKSGLNWFINEKGEYNEKPHFANFWKQGFLNDIPTRADYGRIMDGIKYSDSFVDRNEYQTDEEYKAALKSYEYDHLSTIENVSNRGSFRGG